MQKKDYTSIYIHYLIEQYLNSIRANIENVNLHSEIFLTNFSKWIKNNQLIGDKYIEFVDYMNVKPSHENNIVEVGKGKYDSIALSLNLPIITQFDEGMKELSRSYVINKQFFVPISGEPCFLEGFNLVNVSSEITVERFVTHNPYNIGYISSWSTLHNKGHNITIGVFGDIRDKDKESKIKMLKEIKKEMFSSELKDEYAINGDAYFYAIASNRKVKSLKLTF